MKKILAPLLVLSLIVSCTSQKQSAGSTTLHFKGYRIEKGSKADSSLTNMLKPYADKMNGAMNAVIGFSTKGLTKKQPESELGNFMADCMREMAEQNFKKHVDAAFVNYGGIRSYIPKGDITVGKVYELMPFDNLIVIQELKGSVFRLFLNKIVERGSWPVSGITMKIKDKKPVDILVDGKPLDDNATYVVANSDYVANGGDDCDMLRNIAVVNNGYVFRDAIIQFIQIQTAKGKAIDWQLDGRVTY